MKIIEEGRLRFEFGEKWSVVEKWDASPIYRSGLQKLSGELYSEQTGQTARVGSRAVDILGVSGDNLYLIEVKDYRGHAITTKKRQTGDLPLSIGCKVRDTVAGLIGASRTYAGGHPGWVDVCAKALIDRRRRVYVIAWITDAPERPSEPNAKRHFWQTMRRKEITQLVAWLTPDVLVANPLDAPLPDVTVHSLPSAEQR